MHKISPTAIYVSQNFPGGETHGSSLFEGAASRRGGVGKRGKGKGGEGTGGEGRGNGCGEARKVVCSGARTGSRRACRDEPVFIHYYTAYAIYRVRCGRSRTLKVYLNWYLVSIIWSPSVSMHYPTLKTTRSYIQLYLLNIRRTQKVPPV